MSLDSRLAARISRSPNANARLVGYQPRNLPCAHVAGKPAGRGSLLLGVKFGQQLDDSIDVQALAANDVFSPLDPSDRRGWSLGRALLSLASFQASPRRNGPVRPGPGNMSGRGLDYDAPGQGTWSPPCILLPNRPSPPIIT